MSEALRLVTRERLGDAPRWHMPMVESRQGAGAQAAPDTATELAALAEEARQRGFEQGLAEGRRDARVELQRQLAQLRGLCAALARPLADVDASVERQLAELATLVARGVVQAELRLQPEQLLGVVRQAVHALPAATTQVQIRVHPHAAALLRDGLDEAQENGWRIVEDASLAPGDCRIAGADSRIDARVATRLAALVDAALEDIVAPMRGAADDATGEMPPDAAG